MKNSYNCYGNDEKSDTLIKVIDRTIDVGDGLGNERLGFVA